MNLLAPTLLIISFASPTPAQQTSATFTVAAVPDPSADFQDLQVAIDSVPEGSTLILLPGHHDNLADFFVIDGKSLQLMGTDPFGFAPTSARLEVRNIAQGQEVRLYGLRSGQQVDDVTGLAQLWAHDCAGDLYVQSCDLHAPDSFLLGSRAGLDLDNVANANLVGCTVLGSLFNPDYSTRVAGTSRVAFYDCAFLGEVFELQGGCAGCLSCECNAGLQVETGSDVWLYGGTAFGGGCPLSTADCSAAAVQSGATLTVRGSFLSTDPDLNGAPVVDVEPGGTYLDETQIAPVRRLFVPAIVGASASFDLTISAQPGDLAWIYLSGSSSLLPLPDLSSILALEVPTLLYGVVAIDASGQHQASFPAPSVAPGEALQGLLQGLCIPTSPGAGSPAVLTGPMLVTVLG
jgi:hypothetical protein